ncbi:unnamed protein product [Amoebophrya sp. A25]|nr:unnamed protein product [Amoebophrya sp. A25]|eukprot:GSA25T00025491001.1
MAPPKLTSELVCSVKHRATSSSSDGPRVRALWVETEDQLEYALRQLGGRNDDTACPIFMDCEWQPGHHLAQVLSLTRGEDVGRSATSSSYATEERSRVMEMPDIRLAMGGCKDDHEQRKHDNVDEHEVFLIDVPQFQKSQNLMDFLQWLLNSKRLFCFAPANDVAKLSLSFDWRPQPKNLPYYVHDMQRVNQQVVEQSSSTSASATASAVTATQRSIQQQSRLLPSLQTRVRQVLGLEMSKEEQCSDWKDRPLSQAQVKYAALDVYLLWELHKATIPQQEMLECSGCNTTNMLDKAAPPYFICKGESSTFGPLTLPQGYQGVLLTDEAQDGTSDTSFPNKRIAPLSAYKTLACVERRNNSRKFLCMLPEQCRLDTNRWGLTLVSNVIRQFHQQIGYVGPLSPLGQRQENGNESEQLHVLMDQSLANAWDAFTVPIGHGGSTVIVDKEKFLAMRDVFGDFCGEVEIEQLTPDHSKKPRLLAAATPATSLSSTSTACSSPRSSADVSSTSTSVGLLKFLGATILDLLADEQKKKAPKKFSLHDAIMKRRNRQASIMEPLVLEIGAGDDDDEAMDEEDEVDDESDIDLVDDGQHQTKKRKQQGNDPYGCIRIHNGGTTGTADRAFWYPRYKTYDEYEAAVRQLPASLQNKISQMAPEKRVRYIDFSKRFTAKTQVYGNFSLLSSQGELLAKCDKKKIQWYLRKGLAEPVEGDDSAIKLKFDPEGRKHYGEMAPEDLAKQKKADAFYVREKENICVSCGATKNYLRFHIVPTIYRKHFPEEFKAHSSHDVLLLCVACQERAQQGQYRLMARLEDDLLKMEQRAEEAQQVAAEVRRVENKELQVLGNGGGFVTEAASVVGTSRSQISVEQDVLERDADEVLAEDEKTDKSASTSSNSQEQTQQSVVTKDRARVAALAIWNDVGKQQIPDDRHDELKQRICDHFSSKMDNRRPSAERSGEAELFGALDKMVGVDEEIDETKKEQSTVATPPTTPADRKAAETERRDKLEQIRSSLPTKTPFRSRILPPRDSRRRFAAPVKMREGIERICRREPELPLALLERLLDDHVHNKKRIAAANAGVVFVKLPLTGKKDDPSCAHGNGDSTANLGENDDRFGSNPRKNVTTQKLVCRQAGQRMVTHWLQQNKLADFIRMWRQNFLDTESPKFLPAGWDVQSKCTRAFGKHSRFQRCTRNAPDPASSLEKGVFQVWDRGYNVEVKVASSSTTRGRVEADSDATSTPKATPTLVQRMRLPVLPYFHIIKDEELTTASSPSFEIRDVVATSSQAREQRRHGKKAVEPVSMIPTAPPTIGDTMNPTTSTTGELSAEEPTYTGSETTRTLATQLFHLPFVVAQIAVGDLHRWILATHPNEVEEKVDEGEDEEAAEAKTEKQKLKSVEENNSNNMSNDEAVQSIENQNPAQDDEQAKVQALTPQQFFATSDPNDRPLVRKPFTAVIFLPFFDSEASQRLGIDFRVWLRFHLGDDDDVAVNRNSGSPARKLSFFLRAEKLHESTSTSTSTSTLDGSNREFVFSIKMTASTVDTLVHQTEERIASTKIPQKSGEVWAYALRCASNDHGSDLRSEQNDDALLQEEQEIDSPLDLIEDEELSGSAEAAATVEQSYGKKRLSSNMSAEALYVIYSADSPAKEKQLRAITSEARELNALRSTLLQSGSLASVGPCCSLTSCDCRKTAHTAVHRGPILLNEEEDEGSYSSSAK